MVSDAAPGPTLGTAPSAGAVPRLAIFDLDHTLIDGDTDTLWCNYLIDHGHLPAHWHSENLAMEAQYRSGTLSAQAFSAFYARTLTALVPAQLDAVRAQFTRDAVLPRTKPGTPALLAHHRARGDTLVLSTATSRYLCAATAAHLGFAHVIATELHTNAQGHFNGAPCGTLNMRAGKVLRLREWLATQGWPDSPALWHAATFYSDSINDAPLLQAVGHPVVVDPDPLLRAHAVQHGWPMISLMAPESLAT